MYKGVSQSYAGYWAAYGGARALLRSPYLHAALALLLLTQHFWLSEKWWDLSASVLPNLVGFSLGGLAMFLSFGDDKFRAFLSEGDATEDAAGGPSAYLEVCATFVHFIVLQSLALIAAVLAKALDYVPPAEGSLVWAQILQPLGSAVGFGLFLYSLTSMLAAVMAMFRLCRWYQAFKRVG